MSAKDKAKNTTQNAAGKAKEAVGRVTKDRSTEMSGRRDQVGADLKNAGEQAKDAARKTKDAFEH